MIPSIYSILAPYYDRWNSEINTVAWTDAMVRVFERFLPGGVESVLDLACGTGMITRELARRGYDMIGIDLSPEMLNIARDRAEAEGVSDRILWLCQDMTAFELYGTVEAVVSCLDSVNHLTGNGELAKCFSLVHNYLVPDGLFLFDLNSRLRFETEYGDETYQFEAPGVFCCWQNRYRKKTHLCDFGITLFKRENGSGLYRRYDETESERMYPIPFVKRTLAECGFEILGVWNSPDGGELTGEEKRWHFVARAIKNAFA